jgi:hypothetical protein
MLQSQANKAPQTAPAMPGMQADDLRRQAARCRRLAASATADDAARNTLSLMAAEYDAKADQLDRR